MTASVVSMPVPFDTIPNSTPYPFYSSPSTVFEFFNQLFSNKKRNPFGFMPCKTSCIPDTQTSPFEIIITNSKDNDDSHSYCSSLSSDDSIDDTIEMEDSISVMLNDNTSSSVLSDILYEQIKNSSREMSLETFGSFETHPSAKDSLVKTTPKLQQERKPSTMKKEKVDPIFVREIRSNTDYLRMIVAEVNMMRSQKIIGPLKPRRVLPKRLDPFVPKSSPLTTNPVNQI